MRAEIVNLDPETNPKLKEIFDLLLIAGYFRIRIPSIQPLDKILGGLSWCITQSNFAIDIQYSDDYNIGQKIKVSEKIVSSLEKMSCPYKLQPHQIQGLDLQSIYPIIKWLIKFVIETREYRQDQNSRVSKQVGKNALEVLQQQDEEEKKAIQEVIQQLDLIQDQRQTKNIKKLNKRDPLRVYSTLIEYGDLSSQKTYNKFCALISGIQKQKGASGKNEQNVSSVLLGEPVKEKKQDNNQQITLEQLNNLQKEKNLQTQAQIKEMSQITGPSEGSTLNDEEGQKFQRLQRRNSIAGQSLQNLISQEQIAQGLKEIQPDNELSQVNLQIQEKQLLEQQYKLQQQTLVNLERKIQLDQQEIDYQSEVYETQNQQLEVEKKRKQELEDALKIMDQKAKKANLTEIRKAEEIVRKRQELKDQRSQLKKEIKIEYQQLEEERERALASIPEDDSERLQELKQEYNQKKERYENKFTQFQQLNQEIALLQRKIESFPSPAEIAQYHQRFVELYDAINQEMEENKKQIMRYNNLQELKQWAGQFVEIMQTFKENYQINLKDKKGKQELSRNLDKTFDVLINCHKKIATQSQSQQYN